jgi:hypothetical protein
VSHAGAPAEAGFLQEIPATPPEALTSCWGSRVGRCKLKDSVTRVSAKEPAAEAAVEECLCPISVGIGAVIGLAPGIP